MRCISSTALLNCTLHRKNKEFGRLRARRSGHPLPVQDYTVLFTAMEAALRTHHYRPESLQDPRWLRALRKLANLLARAQDDLDALAAWQQVAAKFPESHLRLLRARAAPESNKATDADPQRSIRLDWQGSVAILRIDSFALPPEAAADRLRHVFEQLVPIRPSALIVDLRGNSGGNLSAMLLAGHLFADPMPAGYFVTRRWWNSHSQAPTPAQAEATFEQFAEFDLARFRVALNQTAGLYGIVAPRTPHYNGPVYLLVDSASASATEALAYLLQQEDRAALVGERTAGAMLSSDEIELENGWQFTLPVADYYAADGARLEGVGVVPDHQMQSSQALQTAMDLAATAPSQ